MSELMCKNCLDFGWFERFKQGVEKHDSLGCTEAGKVRVAVAAAARTVHDKYAAGTKSAALQQCLDASLQIAILEGGGKVILPEPQALLTPDSKMPGLDGQKMSKSYGNTITLRDTTDEVSEKVRRMPTDPARVRRTDPGEPEICPVFQLHKVYTDEATHDWVKQGCRTAGIGCLDCKKPVIDAIAAELAPMQQRAREYEANPDAVHVILNEGTERARDAARDTLQYRQ